MLGFWDANIPLTESEMQSKIGVPACVSLGEKMVRAGTETPGYPDPAGDHEEFRMGPTGLQ